MEEGCPGREGGVKGRRHAQAHSRCPVHHVQLNGVDIKLNLKIYSSVGEEGMPDKETGSHKGTEVWKVQRLWRNTQKVRVARGLAVWLEELGKECGKEFGADHEGPQDHLKNVDCLIGNGE